ncbi:MAG: hypothetical protein ACLQGP_16750 [Isosphaeraceae bacterium]
MAVDSESMSQREQRLHQVLAAFFEAADRGDAPDRRSLSRIIPTSPPISSSSSPPGINSMS